MLNGINTECVNAHVDVICVAVNKIIINNRVFCVQVNAVACNLCSLTGVVVPVERLLMMIDIICIFIFIFHSCNTGIILSCRKQIIIICRKNTVRSFYKTICCIKVALFCKHRFQIYFTEVTCMIQNDILNNFHALCMTRIN